jgi:hypothetical protein
MRTRRRIAAASLMSCVAMLLVGCSDGVVELPRSQVTPAAPVPAETTAPSPSPTEGSPVTPTPSASPSSPRPSKSLSPSRSPNPPGGDVEPATCGPAGGTTGGRGVPPTFLDDDAELDVEGQPGNGQTVDIEEVQLSRKDGFVVICSLEDGRRLGLRRIARSNEERSVEVTLVPPLTKRTRLLAALFADINDDGRFDWATDPIVSGDDDDPTDYEADDFTYRYN